MTPLADRSPVFSGMMASAGGSIRVLTLLGACALGGCATGGGTPQVRLVPDPRPVEPDIPLPLGFRLVDQASEDHRSAGSQRLYLRHEYAGKADKHAIRTFYREQMPLARWRLLSDANVKGDFSMRFEKGSESCTIQITDRDKVFSKAATVRVVVAHEEPASDPPRARKGP